MIIAPARVQPAKAVIENWSGRFTFHAISEPKHGCLTVYHVDAGVPGRKAA